MPRRLHHQVTWRPVFFCLPLLSSSPSNCFGRLLINSLLSVVRGFFFLLLRLKFLIKFIVSHDAESSRRGWRNVPACEIPGTQWLDGLSALRWVKSLFKISLRVHPSSFFTLFIQTKSQVLNSGNWILIDRNYANDGTCENSEAYRESSHCLKY